ncbi:MAG: aldolase/citrate lyase family protein [Ruminococcus flavefaciens]
MALTLMYITNNPVTAAIAQAAGVDRIWIDMEYIGKDLRQGGMDTVQNHHTIADIERIRPIVNVSELMVRINPIHERNAIYVGSEEEIEQTIRSGADVIMLPFFKCRSEVERFISCVDGRVKTMLLVETAEAVENIEDILSVPGIDEVHIGLNDLHLAYHKRFMFELLCDGTVQRLCSVFNRTGIKYGFGGIARVGFGMLPAEYIIGEHYHLGSTAAILSRGFCDANRVSNPREVESIFVEGVKNIRLKETEVAQYTEEQYLANLNTICERVERIVNA